MMAEPGEVMTGRERYLTALRGGTPDCVPLHELHWSPRFIKEVLGEPFSPHYNADDEVAMARATGVDMVWTGPLGFTALTSVQLNGEAFVDEWGTPWGSNEQSWPAAWSKDDIVKARADWERISASLPDPDRADRMLQPRRFVELAAGDLAVVGGVRGPFSAVWMLAGLVNMGTWLYDDPGLLAEMLGVMGRWNTQLALNLVKAGVDAVVIHDDWGMNKATFIRPKDWSKFVFPVIAEQVTRIAATGVPVILHSDGNLNAILPDIVQLPIVALNPIQRSAAMDLAEIKQRYGERLCLIGNLDTSGTLSHGTPDHVERQVLECLRDAAPGGGYILAPDHSYHGAIPTANIWRALQACRKYGSYPLDRDAIVARLTQLEGAL
jgi:uroporphyrinogen decarboxylase